MELRQNATASAEASYEDGDKEHIGSHIVRRCEIHDCGQTGIVGHLGRRILCY